MGDLAGRKAGAGLLVLAAILAAGLNAARAGTETISYDPESCATEAGGRAFVRPMNGQAFAFPAETHLFLRGQPGWPDETFADPEEPVGRPLHPITSRSMAVGYRPVAPRNPSEPEDRRWRPDVLRLITNPNAGGPHVMQEIYLRLFEKNCPDRPTERTRKNRLVEVSSVLQDRRIGQRD